MKRLSIITFLLIGFQLSAAELYVNEDFGFEISFPKQFEIEEFSDDYSETVSGTCTAAGMIFIVNAIKFKKEFTEEERLKQEAESTVNICASLSSKWKLRKITSWGLGDETGFICPIKGKKKSEKGKVGFFGNFFVIMVGQTQYQLTVLAPKRKMFDGHLERGFANSLRLL